MRVASPRILIVDPVVLLQLFSDTGRDRDSQSHRYLFNIFVRSGRRLFYLDLQYYNLQ